jgi:hypothetical protein
MVIYLRHPVHGAKVAISDLEALYDEANGWERFDPTVPESEPEIANQLTAKRRGRPPKSDKE